MTKAMTDEQFTWCELDQQYLEGPANRDAGWLERKLRGALAKIEADRVELESAHAYHLDRGKRLQARIAELEAHITEDYR